MVVRDIPLLQYVFGAVCVTASFVFAGLSLSEGDAGLLTPSAIALGMGTLIVLISPVTTATFDRARGTFEVRRRGLIRTRVEGGPLAYIADVRVDEAITDPVYRVVLVLRSGAQVPLASWWANSRRRSRRVAARLTAFLVDA